MGKNQAYKAMQRARLGSSSAAPEQIEDGMVRPISYRQFLLPSPSADFAILPIPLRLDVFQSYWVLNEGIDRLYAL